MAIFLGNQRITGIKGISRVFLGSTLVFSAEMTDDDYLSYFIYTENTTNITITGIYYDKWYSRFGNYDIYIPETLHEKPVLLQA